MSVHTKLTIDGRTIHLDTGPNRGEVVATLETFYTTGLGSRDALQEMAKELRDLADAIDRELSTKLTPPNTPPQEETS